MTYRVRIDPVAQGQIDHFAEYLSKYDEDFAVEQIERLDRILQTNLAEAPLTWGYFPLTGAPYRSYLFRVGRRTHYWIFTPWMRIAARSTFCPSGTRREIRTLSISKRFLNGSESATASAASR